MIINTIIKSKEQKKTIFNNNNMISLIMKNIYKNTRFVYLIYIYILNN